MSGGLRVTSLQKSIALRVASRHCRQARPGQLTAFRIWGNQKATFWIITRIFYFPNFTNPKQSACIDSATRVAASTWVRRPCTMILLFSSIAIPLANVAQRLAHSGPHPQCCSRTQARFLRSRRRPSKGCHRQPALHSSDCQPQGKQVCPLGLQEQAAGLHQSPQEERTKNKKGNQAWHS